MKAKTKLTIKYFLLRKAKELFPKLVWVILIFSPMLIAENFLGVNFDTMCQWWNKTACMPYGMRAPFIIITFLVELVFYLIFSHLWNWLRRNWFMATLDAQIELRKKRKQKKERNK